MSSLVGGHKIRRGLICSADSLLESAALNVDWWRPTASKPQSLKATLRYRDTSMNVCSVMNPLVIPFDTWSPQAGSSKVLQLSGKRQLFVDSSYTFPLSLNSRQESCLRCMERKKATRSQHLCWWFPKMRAGPGDTCRRSQTEASWVIPKIRSLPKVPVSLEWSSLLMAS